MTPHAHRAGGRRSLRISDIFREHGDTVAARFPLPEAQRRVLRAVQRCRTAALGGRLLVCDDCGASTPVYNSCRDRHCPTCQVTQQEAWIQARMERVLPARHFHVVFTLPGQLRQLVPGNQRRLYELLFRCAADTLLRLGEERLGAQLGLTGVLHTWTRDLRLHPHVHFVVTGGGLSREEEPKWISSHPRFLFPVAVMRELFRGKILDALRRARRRGKLDLPPHLVDDNGWEALMQGLSTRKWVVYCKRPFAGPRQVFAYLGRYTHRVGISNARILSVTDDAVVFRTRGDGSCSLHPHQFIRRFLQHTLPRGFRKIRHFGLLAPSSVKVRLAKAMALLATESASVEPRAASREDPEEEKELCPACGGRLHVVLLPALFDTGIEPWDTS